MVHVTVQFKGRSFKVELPEGADVTVKLDEGEAEPGRQTVLLGAGPSARRLYRWLVGLSMGRDVVSIDPVMAEKDLGLVPIALGRTLGSLEKLGRVEVLHRRKADRSKVIAYKIKLLGGEATGPVEEGDPWLDTVGDIETVLGKRARALFEALCVLADVDGNVLMVTQRDVCMSMHPIPDAFPVEDFRELDRGDWIGIEEEEPLNCGVMGWSVLGPACPLRR